MANPATCTATPAQAATGNNGNVMGYLYQDPPNPTLQHSATYTFDAVNRLSSATAKDLSSNTLWTQSYIFTTDSSNGQYGNMTCMLGGSGYCPQVTFSSSTNRVSQIGSLTASYDPAGNMTGDGTHTYQWDAEDRLVSMDSGSTTTYKYNALGQRVERFLPNGSWTFDYLFGVGGEDLGVYSAGTAAWFDQEISMGGRILVDYGSPTRILHGNKLGTTTVTNDQTGAELQDELFYPWGQDWTRAGQPYIMHFAGMTFESPDQQYLTAFRKYTPALGRWTTPDAMGGDVTNPQSLNRYGYVLNNPTTLTDPSGLGPCDSLDSLDCGPPCDAFDAEGCQNGCNPVWAESCVLYCYYLGTCNGRNGGGGGSSGGGGGAPPPPSAPPAGQPPLRGGTASGYVSGEEVLDMTSLVLKSISRACGGNSTCIEILTGSAEGLGSIVGIAGVIGSVIFMQSDAPPAAARAKFPTVEEVKRNCTAVGGPIVEPSTSRPGWTSEEQEYNCQGVTYTIHCLVSPTRASMECHVRPGPPKGGGN